MPARRSWLRVGYYPSFDSYPPGNQPGGVYEPISHYRADRGSDNTISNLIDHPIRQCSPHFGLRIIRSNDGNNGGQHADHIQGGGDHSNPRQLAGEYDDSLDEIPEHRPSPFSATAAERWTGD